MSSGNDEPLTQPGGGALSALNPLAYVDGTQIQWGKLLRRIFGAGLFAAFSGWASIILGIADIPISLLGELARFGGAVVEVIATMPALLLRGAWGEAATLVESSGAAGFVVAIGIVLATLYTLSWVVSRVQ